MVFPCARQDHDDRFTRTFRLPGNSDRNGSGHEVRGRGKLHRVRGYPHRGRQYTHTHHRRGDGLFHIEDRRDPYAQIVDYRDDCLNRVAASLGKISYARLKSGSIQVRGKDVRTILISSCPRAREIAGLLREWITAGRFSLMAPVEPLPTAGSGIKMKPLEEPNQARAQSA